jgi:hypothetical protein
MPTRAAAVAALAGFPPAQIGHPAISSRMRRPVAFVGGRVLTAVTFAHLKIPCGTDSGLRVGETLACLKENSAMKIGTFAALGLFIATVPALAHHPFASEFDANAPLRLTGKVWNDPHVVVHVAINDPGGQTRNWSLEAASPAMLERKGWTKAKLKEGDQITVQGYRAKSEPFTGAAARSIELPDGKKMSSADDDDGGPKT